MRGSYFSCCCNFLTKSKQKLYFKRSVFNKTNLSFIFVTLAIFIFYNNYYELVFWNQSVKATKSPFYGMFHRESYGQPRSFLRNSKSEISNDDWKRFFPKTVTALQAHRLSNPKHNSNLYTNSFSVFIQNLFYYVGDEFVATIRSFDSNKSQKPFGGDYYRARLIRDNSKYPDGIPCRVTDNEDGSYTVKAPLVFAGRLTLEIVLVISLEGIYSIIEGTKHLPSWGHLFEAKLESGDKVICNSNLTSFEE